MKLLISSFYLPFSILVGLFTTNRAVIAQSIQTDGTTPTQPVSCSGDCLIEAGLQQGDNLFHSFERFNVDAGATVLFQDPGVTNILSRVTGNEISNILGTLGVSGGDANLFLLNPNGIIFGQDSSLDLNGSFLATTADAIRFGEQGLLDTAPNEIPLLTINPSALSFANGNQGVIRNQSIAPAGEDLSGLEDVATGLRVPDGKSLLLVGGDVIFDGGRANAFGGRVELGGLAAAGEINLDVSGIEGNNLSLIFPEQIPRANILLTNEAVVNVPADDGGDIAITANNISILEGSFLRAGIGLNLGTTNSQAGNITLNAIKKLEINNDSYVFNEVAPFAQGNGGDINVNSDSLFISNDSIIQTATFGTGNVGNINVNVPNGVVEISKNSQVSSNQGSLLDFVGIGKGGDIQIVAREILLENNSLIDASTLGQGDAGNIEIFLEENLVVSSNSLIISVVEAGAIGNAGNISIEANNISLDSGSQLVSNVKSAEENEIGGRGKGGEIILYVFDSVNIEGFGINGLSSGIVTTTGVGAEGQAGEIIVNTNSFRIADGAIVSSQTFNQSNGGNISIDANTFEAINGGQIATSAESSGNAGSIDIQVADNLLLSGSDPNFADRLAEFGSLIVINEAPGNSGIFANVRPEASGTGGEIQVAAGQLSILDDAEINVSAKGTGTAGSLNIEAQKVALDRGSLTAETRAGSQGNITLSNADTLLMDNNSQITTNASESATGGDITISSEAIALLNNSDITANAVQGQGGNIQITTQRIFQEPDSQITAASELGIDGTITINTSNVDPTSGILELPGVLIDAEEILAQDLCRLEEQRIARGSSFIITGRGGLTPTSEETLENRDRIVNWASREDLEVSNNGTVGIRQREEDSLDKQYPEIKQSQGLVVAADGSTWLTANAPNPVPQSSKTAHPDCRTIKSETQN
ncbi:MAG: filamentous hemagglutinin N-terminal domain-containing protein [Pleurocapsa sp. MO_226.B13]|nr:filamentous hemagglutinin N-terminal domain-containing protein [Pleurocapsa sp. MO_226.B13]